MAKTVSNQLATDDESGKVVPFSQAIQSKGYQALINSTLKDPKRVNRFVTAVVSAVSANPQLQKCEARTIISAALQGEALELSPSPALGEYALVPYGSNWNAQTKDYDTYKAQFQIMTNGRVQLAMRTAQYEDLDALEIREGEYKGKDKRTGKPIIEFIEDDEEREKQPIIGYYAFFKLLNGFFKSVYFSKTKVIEHAKRYRKAFDYKVFLKVQKGERLSDWKEEKKAETPWIAQFDEMAKNLVLRQVLKKAPKSIEMRTADEVEDKNAQDANLAAVIAEQQQTSEEFFDGTDETAEPVEYTEEDFDGETGEVKPKRGRKKKGESVAATFFDGNDGE